MTSIFTKLVAGVSTRANLLTYFNSNIDVLDSLLGANGWTNFTPTISGIPNRTINMCKYRYIGHKLIQINFKITLTNAVDAIIRFLPPTGITFNFTTFQAGGSLYCMRGTTFYPGFFMNDEQGNLLFINPTFWQPTVPITFANGDVIAGSVIISIQ
jgi:hypothetical protein